MRSTAACFPGPPGSPDRPGELRLRLVGAVEVGGLERALTSQQLSLVTYLSCIGPAGREVLVDAIWDGRPISPGRFANLVSGVRRRLGPAHLPPVLAGRYRLVGLRSDLDVLAEYVAGGAERGGGGADDEDRLASVEEVIGRARGPALDRPGSRYWAWLDDHPEVTVGVEVAVARAAVGLADAFGRRGQLDRARSVCERALTCCPLDDQLIAVVESLHRAQGRSGSAGRLASRWRSRVGPAGDDGPPMAAPSSPVLPGQAPIGSAVTTWLPT